jgi:hypothetical protein
MVFSSRPPGPATGLELRLVTRAGKLSYLTRRGPKDADARDVAPRWSQDGRKILFTRLEPTPAEAGPGARLHGTLYEILNPEAERPNPVPLTAPGFDVESGAWSPDGERVVFSAMGPKDKTQNLYLQDAKAGSKPRKLLAPAKPDGASAVAWAPTWSWNQNGPGTSMIAFLSDQGGGPLLQVWTIKPDGTGLAQVTRNGYQVGQATPIVADLGLDWDPFATHLLFVRQQERARNGPGSWEYRVMEVNAATGAERVIDQGPPGSRSAYPRYTPTGREAIFTSDRAARGEDQRLGGMEAYTKPSSGKGDAVLLLRGGINVEMPEVQPLLR